MEPFFGNFDLAQLALYLFWIFFAGLIYYLQTENMREGYPLENDDGTQAGNQGPFPLPKPKTFKLSHGRGEVTVPDMASEGRDVALVQSSPTAGSPFEPEGDPMIDGVGPASWAPRRDVPELDGHGHPKLVPMRMSEGFRVATGLDPRGLPVIAGDGASVGTISDMWVDEAEQMVRYLEADLDSGGSCLVPMPMARIKRDGIRVRSIFGHHFANVPRIKSPNQVTMLEEEKICAYYGGGTLYASPQRFGPKLG